MPLSTAQRRQINRQNAENSTGPQTEEGKARSRQNALKYGLRAETIDLPNEAPGTAEALATEWHDYYQPDSPGAVVLVDRAVHATIQLRGCARFQAEAVGKRVREAEALWDRKQAEELARLDALFWGADPALAIAGLKTSAVGCARLLDDWEPIVALLDRQGWLDLADQNKAIRLCGAPSHAVERDPMAYLLLYYNVYTLDEPTPEIIAYLNDPKRIPMALRGAIAETRPTPAESRAALLEIVGMEVEALKARLARLEILDAADRAGAADRALLLDGTEGALLLRYEKMHDGIFHRAYSALLKGRKEQGVAEAPHAAEAPIEPQSGPAVAAEAPIEPQSGPAVAAEAPIEPNRPAEAAAPNEANRAAKDSQVATSVEFHGPVTAAAGHGPMAA